MKGCEAANTYGKRLMLFMILFSLVFSGYCFALTTGEVVSRVQQKYGQIWSLTADFTQESTNKMLGQSQVTKAKGKVYFQKPGRMRWEYAMPTGDQWVSDGKTLWFYQPAENQVFVERVDVERSRLFLAFLMGEGNVTEDFDIHRRDQEVDDAKTGYRIELTPKRPHATMNRLILTVDRDSCYVRQADIYDAYDNLTQIRFRRVRVNRELPSHLFTFEIPPDTEVIENPGLSLK